MSEIFHLSEIGCFDPEILRDYPAKGKRVNVRRYQNNHGGWNESYDWVDEDGVVIGQGISTNVEPI